MNDLLPGYINLTDAGGRLLMRVPDGRVRADDRAQCIFASLAHAAQKGVIGRCGAHAFEHGKGAPQDRSPQQSLVLASLGQHGDQRPDRKLNRDAVAGGEAGPISGLRRLIHIFGHAVFLRLRKIDCRLAALARAISGVERTDA